MDGAALEASKEGIARIGVDGPACELDSPDIVEVVVGVALNKARI